VKPVIIEFGKKAEERLGPWGWTETGLLGKLELYLEPSGRVAKQQDEDEINALREEVVDLLVKIGSPGIHSLIIALLMHNKWMRDTAIDALIKIGSPAVEPLIQVLLVGDDDVRCRALRDLGIIGDARALVHLEQIVRENQSNTVKDKTVIGVAREAIDRITATR
jgi:HEAT repeat protein